MIELTQERHQERRVAGGGLPIVAICGRWGKTTVARLLEALVRPVAPRLALWTDQGVQVKGQRQRGELIPWQEALRSLAVGELDLAIQELDAPMVNAVGLPSEAYTLGIVTNFCGNDEACLSDARSVGEQQAQLAVARAVHPRGALVLNADDHAVADECAVSSGDVIYYGASRRNPFIRRQLATGGRAVCMSGGVIVLCQGRRSHPVLPARDVALSLGGAIVFQVQNALAAVAAAWQLGVPIPAMAATLRQFTSTPTLMPGACNQFTIGSATLVVDHLIDPFSARALARGMRRVAGRRRVALLPAIARESLDESAVTEIGRLMGQSFDLVLLHDDAAEREVNAARVAALRVGIAQNRIPPVVLTLPTEGVALDRLLRMLRAGDLALVLAADLPLALRTVLTYQPSRENDLPLQVAPAPVAVGEAPGGKV